MLKTWLKTHERWMTSLQLNNNSDNNGIIVDIGNKRIIYVKSQHHIFSSQYEIWNLEPNQPVCEFQGQIPGINDLQIMNLFIKNMGGECVAFIFQFLQEGPKNIILSIVLIKTSKEALANQAELFKQQQQYQQHKCEINIKDYVANTLQIHVTYKYGILNLFYKKQQLEQINSQKEEDKLMNAIYYDCLHQLFIDTTSAKVNSVRNQKFPKQVNQLLIECDVLSRNTFFNNDYLSFVKTKIQKAHTKILILIYDFNLVTYELNQKSFYLEQKAQSCNIYLLQRLYNNLVFFILAVNKLKNKNNKGIEEGANQNNGEELTIPQYIIQDDQDNMTNQNIAPDKTNIYGILYNQQNNQVDQLKLDNQQNSLLNQLSYSSPRLYSFHFNQFQNKLYFLQQSNVINYDHYTYNLYELNFISKKLRMINEWTDNFSIYINNIDISQTYFIRIQRKQEDQQGNISKTIHIKLSNLAISSHDLRLNLLLAFKKFKLNQIYSKYLVKEFFEDIWNNAQNAKFDIV